MTLKLAISTNKGGVLKTSITTNLAGVLAEKQKILIIDTDNQGNVLLSFGINPDIQECTLYDVLVKGEDPKKAIVPVHKNIDVLPSNDDMSFFEFDVLTDSEMYPNPFRLLKDAMVRLEQEYDLILIDTPPNLGLAQGNVLSYADQVLIPFQPEGYSMRSLLKILQSIYNFRREHNPALSIAGILPTLVDMRTRLHPQILKDCQEFCSREGFYFFGTYIPRSIRFATTVSYERMPATLSAPENPIVQAYMELAEEMEEMLYGTKQ